MLVFLLIVMVLIGVAYADFCLIDNAAHFGICFGKLAEAEEARVEALRAEVEETVAPVVEGPVAEEPEPEVPEWAAQGPRPHKEAPIGPQRNPVPAWLLLELEPVLELHEDWTGAAG